MLQSVRFLSVCLSQALVVAHSQKQTSECASHRIGRSLVSTIATAADAAGRYGGQRDVDDGAAARAHARQVRLPVPAAAGGRRHGRAVRERVPAVDPRRGRAGAAQRQHGVVPHVHVLDAALPAHGRLDRRPRHRRSLRRRLVPAQGDVVVHGDARERRQRYLLRARLALQVRASIYRTYTVSQKREHQTSRDNFVES